MSSSSLSLEALLLRLEEQLAAEPESAELLAEELAAFAATLRGSASLARVASDSSIDSSARQGLVRELLADRLSAGSLALVEQAVSLRWNSMRDLPKAVETAAELATIRSASDVRMLIEELFSFEQSLFASPQLQDALAHPGRTVEDKTALVERLLGGSAMPATVSLVRQGLDGYHGPMLAALAHYKNFAAESLNSRVAVVRVARPLKEQERARLIAALEADFGTHVQLNELVEPNILGGIRVEMGHNVIDGAVSTRVDEARRRLAS
jgi:F-type H+-transporting ATPase subunit delta